MVVAPKLKRNDPVSTGLEQPIAASTREGSLDPLAQADPVEQATPARSNAINRAWRSSPNSATFEVFGNRGARRR